MAKMFSNRLPENKDNCTYSFNKSFVCLSFFWGKKIHKGLRKMFRHFCRTLVIVKSSEPTRTMREGGEGKGKKRSSLMGVFFFFFLAMKLHYQGPRGEKCKTKPKKWRGEDNRKNKNKNKKPQNKNQTTQGRAVGDRGLMGGRQAQEETMRQQNA